MDEYCFQETNTIVEELRSESKLAHNMGLKWEIINYPIDQYISYKRMPLFNILWKNYEVITNFKEIEQSINPTRQQLSVSGVTIEGFGDANAGVYGPMYAIPSNSKQERIFDDGVCKISITESQIFRRYVIPTDQSVIDSIDKKLISLSSKHNIGISGVKTTTSPFWYPIDEYSLDLIFETPYESIVEFTSNIADDLEITIKESELSPNKKLLYEIKLQRKNIFHYIWPQLILVLSLILFYTELSRKNYTLPGLIIIWLITVVTFLHNNPDQLNVPFLNIYNIFSLLIIIISTVPIFNEFRKL